MTDPAIAVVVATRDRPEFLEGCLASICASLRPGDELVVVDSASSDARVAEVARAAGACVLRCDEPGASRARNAGWRSATADVVAFVDDDVRVAPGWATALARCFGERPDLDFVTCRVDMPVGVECERPVALKDDPVPAEIDATTTGLLGHGAAHAVRRSALEAVGGFDERLGAGGEFRAAEDIDLWARLLLRGSTGRYEPLALAYHEQWRSRRQMLTLDASYGYGSGVYIAKLHKLDRERARKALRLLYVDWGVQTFRGEFGYRKYFVAALAVVRMVTGAVGIARGWRVPVRDGHLVPRGSDGREVG